MAVQWDLQGCCDKYEVLFISLYFVYLFLIWFMWNPLRTPWKRYCGVTTDVLKPLKLLGVFVHEFGHASAAWLTCGKVIKIEVYENEGGIAGFSGGVKLIIIPAGYVGGAFWGGAFVAMSGHRIGATVAACLVCFALLLALAHDPNKTVVYIAIGFTIITVAAILIEWVAKVTPFLQYITLFYGVFFGYYACRDIWDDTDSEGSDAQACNKAIPWCKPKAVGIQFLVMALIFQVLGIYFALVLMFSTDWE